VGLTEVQDDGASAMISRRVFRRWQQRARCGKASLMSATKIALFLFA
jgi:stalled ribosome alternative rescue factor ArfA